MPTTLIQSNPTEARHVAAPQSFLRVAEFFCDTIQGEGISTGVPSTFLRLQGCTLDCIWCDTSSVWRYGNPYGFYDLLEMIESVDLHKRLEQGQHLILTGGSPLKQQKQLIEFLNAFYDTFGFKPFIEVENEAVLKPLPEFAAKVNQWNNSPKLSNSGMKERARLKPDVIKDMSWRKNSWFKFVVEKESDWEEIERDYLPLMNKNQIILMPCGENQEQLSITRPIAAEIAIKHQVRFCDRLHVTVWDKKTGV